MSTNIVKEPGWRLSVVCSDPAAPDSGDPVRYGAMTGIAETDEGAGGNISTETSVYFGPCVVDVSVKGVDDSGNSAVALGDTIFYVDADTPKLSKKASGYFFGFALEVIDSGATATIQVQRPATPGGGTLAAGSIGATQLATGAVTAAKLSATLKTGFILLPLEGFRLISSNDIAASGTADGGVLSSDTAPALARVNGATDKALRIAWAAEGVAEIQASFVYPPDLDEASNVEVHILAGMAGATDTPYLTVAYFEGVGDSNAGGNTATLAAAVAEKTVTIAHANVGATPKAATISITPQDAHDNDALYLYGVWIEYTRA